MWQEKLEKVREAGRAFDRACVNPGVSAEALRSWADRVEEALGVRPPREVLEVLRCANGLEWNGFILYGVDRDSLPVSYQVSGLVEQNEIWYEVESQRAYLFLGESNISWYVYAIADGRYLELDNPSGREMGAFSSWGALLEKLLDDCLL